MGYQLNLELPRTLNDKINWLILYDRNEIKATCADKYLVREHVETRIGEQFLIPAYLITEDVSDLVPENLPDHPVIIKATHDSGSNIIVRSKNQEDWNSIRNKCKKWLHHNYYYKSREWQYRKLKPRIIVEKLLINENNEVPFDYKLHFFNGNLVFTQVDIDRHTDHRRNLYDPDWKFIECQWYFENGRAVARPGSYEQMKKLGTQLARDFLYVRVDFYEFNSQVFFGELTFHPGSGSEEFHPSHFDVYFGEKLKLPIDG